MSSPATLTEEQIDKELNSEMLRSGNVENQEQLQQINLGGKKNLLREVKQHKGKSQSDFGSRSVNQSTLDNSSSNFPSLPTSGRYNTQNKLKLPRKPVSEYTSTDTDDSLDKCTDVLDDEVVATRFVLPYCIDDNAPPLSLEGRPVKRVRNAYFVLDGEQAASALKRMLEHHDAWKTAYTAEMRKMEQHALGVDIEDSDLNSPKNDKVEDKEKDPYSFTPNSPLTANKVYSGPRKREPNMSSDNVSQRNNQLVRKTSRDSDCEEVDIVLKPEEPKVNDWITCTTRPRSKRNRKQLLNQDKGKSYEDPPDVEFEFENKWDSKSSSWSTAQSPSSTSLNNQVQARRSLSNVIEEKVQCPICQRNFPKSKVEAHAANCEGYSDSPMDVEEEN